MLRLVLQTVNTFLGENISLPEGFGPKILEDHCRIDIAQLLVFIGTCRCSPAIVSILSTSPDPRPPHVPGSWNARSARCWMLRYSSYKAVPWTKKCHPDFGLILSPTFSLEMPGRIFLAISRKFLARFSFVCSWTSVIWDMVHLKLKKNQVLPQELVVPFAVAQDVQEGVLDVQHVGMVGVEHLKKEETCFGNQVLASITLP